MDPQEIDRIKRNLRRIIEGGGSEADMLEYLRIEGFNSLEEWIAAVDALPSGPTTTGPPSDIGPPRIPAFAFSPAIAAEEAGRGLTPQNTMMAALAGLGMGAGGAASASRMFTPAGFRAAKPLARPGGGIRSIIDLLKRHKLIAGGVAAGGAIGDKLDLIERITGR